MGAGGGNQDAFASTSQTDKGTDAFASTSQGGQKGGQTSGGGGGEQKGGQQSGQTSDAANQAASQVGDILRGDTGAATGAVKGLVSQVKESGGKVASQALGQVKEKAATKIDEQKSTLVQSLGGVADTIRQVGESLKGADEQSGVASTAAKYGDTLAGQVEQFSSYLEKHNVSELMRDVERFARRNPAYFIGGAFALGLLGARFLKSSSPNQALMPYQGGGSGSRKKEVFHHHVEGEPVDAGESITGSGEGIRPV
jgi:hypothetical protein